MDGSRSSRRRTPSTMAELDRIERIARFSNGDGCCGGAGLCPRRKILSVLDRCGLFRCCPSCGPQVLQVTLLSVSNLAMPSGFYFEVSSEPASGQPKISRIHRGSGVIDLNDELLELDWFGDETEVTIHLMACSGNKQSQDIPEGEVRVARSTVQRYAHEASGHDREVEKGSRRFQFELPHESVVVARKKRFQDMLLPAGAIFDRMTKAVCSRIGEENGLEVPSSEEMERLRLENQRLKREYQELREGRPTGSAFDPLPGVQLHSAILSVRFQLQPRRRRSDVDHNDFRKASFQLSEEDDDL